MAESDTWGIFGPSKESNLKNQEAEMVVIGSLMADNTVIAKLPDLRAEHFYYGVNQRIFDTFNREIEEGNHVTPVSMHQMIQDHPGLPKGMNAFQYLIRCGDFGIDTLTTPMYSNMVIDLYNRRKLIELLEETSKKLGDLGPDTKTDKIVTDMSAKILDMQSVTKIQIHTFDHVAKKIVNNMQKPSRACPTGIATLDKCLGGGLYPKKSYCFCARPKMGKTLLLGTIAMNMSVAQRPVLYIAAEMGEEEIHQRNLARFLDVNSMKFYHNRNDADFQQKVKDHVQQNKYLGYYVDAARITFNQLKQVLHIAITKFEIEGFILDYLGLVSGAGERENNAQFQERVTSWLAELCKDRDIWGVYAAQLNREGNLRGSDGAIMNADQVYELHKDDETKTAWMKQMVSRYTALMDCGTGKDSPGMRLHKNGPHFKDVNDTYDGYVPRESAFTGDF